MAASSVRSRPLQCPKKHGSCTIVTFMHSDIHSEKWPASRCCCRLRHAHAGSQPLIKRAAYFSPLERPGEEILNGEIVEENTEEDAAVPDVVTAAKVIEPSR